VLISRGDLQLDRLVPEILIATGEWVELSDRHLPICARMHPQLSGFGDEPDYLVELVFARHELLAGAAERSVDSVPGQGHVLDPRFLAELELEQALPSRSVAGPGCVVKQQQVSPPVRRVAGRANHQVSIAAFDDVVGG